MSEFINSEYRPESKEDKLKRLTQPDRIDPVELPIDSSDNEIEDSQKIVDSDWIKKERELTGRLCSRCKLPVGHMQDDTRCEPCQKKEYDEKFERDLEAFNRRNYRESL